MPKPTPQEYQAAIQHPKICFQDVELKNGFPQLNNLQLPKTISGGFASVFQINCGGKKYAARCLIRDSEDIEKRYKAIDDYLNKVNLDYMIDFDYLEKGILVNGKWLPLIKMEWIEGHTLDEYVNININNSARIENIAAKFKQMISDLKIHSISHCDLHHGNIMIINEEIKLLDYDAMYVPELHGFVSNEVGHPNYQHPFRDYIDFNPTVDNFSEWVIYLSLIALSKKPQLWTQLNGGDECLLFRRNDFENPTTSRVFSLVGQIVDETFKIQLENFQSSIYNYDLTSIPSLNDKLESIISPFITHVGFQEEVSPIGQIERFGEGDSSAFNSSWIWENKEVILTHNIGAGSKERVLSRISLILIGMVFVLYFYNIITPVILVACISSIISAPLFLYGKYYTVNTRVLEKQSLRLRLNDVIDKKKKVQVTYNNSMEAKRGRYTDVVDKINKTNVIRRENKQLEKNDIRDTDDTIRKLQSDLQFKRRDYAKQEMGELRAELKKVQSLFLYNNLSRHRIRNANIPLVGTGRSQTLAQSGIKTAADFVDVQILYFNNPNGQAFFKRANGSNIQVQGIGPMIAQSINQWRNSYLTRYTRNMPKNLTRNKETSIKNRYTNLFKNFEQNQNFKISNEKNKYKLIISKYKKIDGDHIKYIEDLKRTFISENKQYDETIQLYRDDLSTTVWNEGKINHELKSYSKISLLSYMINILKNII